MAQRSCHLVGNIRGWNTDLLDLWCIAAFDRSHAPRGSARQTLRVACWRTQSVTSCVPTRSVGTINVGPASKPAPTADLRCITAFDRSHAPRGSASPDAPRRLLEDAERHKLRSHAERGNDQRGLPASRLLQVIAQRPSAHPGSETQTQRPRIQNLERRFCAESITSYWPFQIIVIQQALHSRQVGPGLQHRASPLFAPDVL